MLKEFFKTSELCDRYSVTSRTIDNWRKVRDFPNPVWKVSGSGNRYLRLDVLEWEDGQMAGA